MSNGKNLSADIKRKLSAARTKLILDKPFLGALVLRLPLESASPEWCMTTATDAKKFYYNPEYIASLSLPQTQFMLAHEAMHCALSHFTRRQHRDQHRWDVACDFAINTLLVQDGLTPPLGALLAESYEGMTAEEIYPYIIENSDEETLDKHVYDDSHKDDASNKNNSNSHSQTEKKNDTPGASQPQQAADGSPNQANDNTDNDKEQGAEPKNTNPSTQDSRGAAQPQPLTEVERDSLKVQWQQRLAGAAQQARQAGKLGDAMARIVDHLLEPQLPWRSLLAHYMTCAARDDYSYARPNTRRGEPAIYPSLRSEDIDLIVVLDISGSISDSEMKEFITEINAIKAQLRARVVFHACDAELEIDGPWIFEAWENFSIPKEFKGGGATDFRPVFNWLNKQDMQPQLLIYFTDGEGGFPDLEPDFPVLWLVKGKAKVPWGQRVQLN